MSVKIEWNLDIMENVLTVIESGVAKKYPKKMILQELKGNVASYQYMNSVFNQTMEYTLGKYIMRRILTEGYMELKITGRRLTYRDSYRNEKNFAKKFKEEFNMGLEDALQLEWDSEEMQPAIPYLQMESLIETLVGFDAVDTFEMRKGGIELKLHEINFLRAAMKMPVYVFPAAPLVAEELYRRWIMEPEKERVVLLIIWDQVVRTGQLKNSFSLDELETAFFTVKNMDLDAKNKVGGLFVFSVPVPDNFKAFKKIVEMDFEHLKSTLPLENAGFSLLATELRIISDAKNLRSLAEELNMKPNVMLKRLWDYTKKGYLRIAK